MTGLTSGDQREFIVWGCRQPPREEEGGRCEGPVDDPIYSSYINLVIRPISILYGEIDDDAKPLSVELPWPRNAPLDPLRSRAPLGARVLVIAEPVPNAQEGARPLVEAGIVGADSIAPNLLRTGPYGLSFENSEGFVDDAFDGAALKLVVSPDVPITLDALVAEVERSASEL